MGNNPFNNMNPNNPLNSNKMGQVRNIMNMFRNSNNPMQLFQQMAMNNPQLQPILNAVKNGANIDGLFNQMCQQKGVNPEEFKRMIKGN